MSTPSSSAAAAAERARKAALGRAPKRGRPSKYPNYPNVCVTCLDIGRVPPEAKPKKYGSYCSKHYAKRQRDSYEGRRAQRDFVRGYWDLLPEPTRRKEVALCERKVLEAGTVPARTQTAARQLAWAFEHACVQYAIELQRQLSPDEEDEVIERFGGDRAGQPIEWAPTPGRPSALGPNPIQLPDSKIRRQFRAEMRGGPTTLGEPTFAQYYETFHGAPPAAEYLEGFEDKTEESEFVDIEFITIPIKREMARQYDEAVNAVLNETPLSTAQKGLLFGSGYDFRTDELRGIMEAQAKAFEPSPTASVSELIAAAGDGPSVDPKEVEFQRKFQKYRELGGGKDE